MPSKKRKVQGYLSSEVEARYVQWKTDQGIDSDSAALNALLGDYFQSSGNLPSNTPGNSLSDPPSNLPSDTPELMGK